MVSSFCTCRPFPRLWSADFRVVLFPLLLAGAGCRTAVVFDTSVDAASYPESGDANSTDDASDDPESPNTLDPIRALIAGRELLELAGSEDANVALTPRDIPEVSGLLWKKYVASIAADPTRSCEDSQRQIDYGGLSMRYTSLQVGVAPADGYSLYIALHGGGQGAASANDSQWSIMQGYYLRSVSEGFYIAPRGITDTYDLHSRPESFVMYDRLIENMIALHGVDANRVFVLGFSAGGDGTYQVAARMTDRFAAANMSAGHPNGLDMRNLGPLPFALQVGEMDSLYDRNKVTVQYGGMLDMLQVAAGNPYYRHVLYVHYNQGHNFIDNDSQPIRRSVLARPQAWLATGDRRVVAEDTRAVAWLSGFSRVAHPDVLQWDLNTGADRSAPGFAPSPARGRQYYWLDRRTYMPRSGDVASVRQLGNTIDVAPSTPPIWALLHHSQFDLNRPIEICRGQTCRSSSITPNLGTLIQTLLDRGDPAMMFSARVPLDTPS